MPSSEVMHKFGSGQLHSGGSGGPKVTNQKQAVAIMLSEKRKEKAHGGVYPESHKEGGPVFAKGSAPKEASYAAGGPVLGRTTDFLKTPDRFRQDGSGRFAAPKPEPTEDVWGKGSSKANPKGADKSEKPIKPRG